MLCDEPSSTACAWFSQNPTKLSLLLMTHEYHSLNIWNSDRAVLTPKTWSSNGLTDGKRAKNDVRVRAFEGGNQGASYAQQFIVYSRWIEFWTRHLITRAMPMTISICSCKTLEISIGQRWQWLAIVASKARPEEIGSGWSGSWQLVYKVVVFPSGFLTGQVEHNFGRVLPIGLL